MCENSLKSLDYEILLFYGWIAFEGIVDHLKIINLKLLAFILSSWSNRRVSKAADMRIVCRISIGSFFFTFDKLYSGMAYVLKMNLHFLCLLPKMIENYAPLPVQSTYFTENTMSCQD